jgi:hypothetical protein
MSSRALQLAVVTTPTAIASGTLTLPNELRAEDATKREHRTPPSAVGEGVPNLLRLHHPTSTAEQERPDRIQRRRDRAERPCSGAALRGSAPVLEVRTTSAERYGRSDIRAQQQSRRRVPENAG